MLLITISFTNLAAQDALYPNTFPLGDVAALEGLTTQLQRNLQMLEKIWHFKASELLLFGGGSRNTLWNQDVYNRQAYIPCYEICT